MKASRSSSSESLLLKSVKYRIWSIQLSGCGLCCQNILTPPSKQLVFSLCIPHGRKSICVSKVETFSDKLRLFTMLRLQINLHKNNNLAVYRSISETSNSPDINLGKRASRKSARRIDSASLAVISLNIGVTISSNLRKSS